MVCITVMMIFAGAGCSRNAGTAKSSGNEINGTNGINESRRIISAAPSNTEIIVGLGQGENLVAADKYSRDIQGIPAGLPLIDFFYPDTEAIIGLEPDLILISETNTFGVSDNPFKLLGELGIKVIQIPAGTSIAEIMGDILLIAESLGVRERGEVLVNSMKKEIETIAAAAEKAGSSGKKSVYYEISAEPAMYSFGRGTYLNEMIEIAGGKNIFEDETGWISAGAEEILSRNPDIILVMAYPGEDPVTEIKNRKPFEGLNAIRENRVYAIDSDSASRPSQNILLALRQMAGAINP